MDVLRFSAHVQKSVLYWKPACQNYFGLINIVFFSLVASRLKFYPLSGILFEFFCHSSGVTAGHGRDTLRYKIILSKKACFSSHRCGLYAHRLTDVNSCSPYGGTQT